VTTSHNQLSRSSCVLTVNGGSSSLKFAIFERDDPPLRRFAGRIERIGQDHSKLFVADAASGQKTEREVNAPDPQAAVRLVIEWLGETAGFAAIAVVGHRIVHGGRRYHQPERVGVELLEYLRTIGPFDPDHLPGEIAIIEAFQNQNPGLLQVACFDTAFHHDLPRVAQILPIPRRFEAAGVRRYGFHGLSYAYLMEELTRLDGPNAARGRVILAHLGSGASMAAVKDGQPVDTSMAFTPTAGLVMGTRSGDLDPGLVWFLAQGEGMSAEQFHKMVNHDAGLLGVSEISSDVRDLLARRATDQRAADALDVFCYQAKKTLGAYAAALGGLDTLVFSGGIGENSSAIRAQICAGLEFLGITVDPEHNIANARVISADAARVKVRVIATDEEIMIAKQALAFATANE
jgi:acetate kinase